MTEEADPHPRMDTHMHADDWVAILVAVFEIFDIFMEKAYFEPQFWWFCGETLIRELQ